ncbi:site-specific integrase [Vibrio cholerae]
MALIGVNKRKTLTANIVDNVHDIRSLNKIFSDGHTTADLERLCFKDCPVLEIKGKKHPRKYQKTTLVDMNRRQLVYKITTTLNGMDRTVRTKINTFSILLELFRFCDSRNIVDVMAVSTIAKYIESLAEKYHAGVKGKNLLQKQATLRSFIKEFDPVLLSELKPHFFEFPQDSQSIVAYTDSELKQLAQALEQIFQNYAESLEQDVLPSRFPLESADNSKVRAVKANTNADQWKSDLSRAAYFLTCLYTGINASPLLALKHSDINIESFKEVSRGVYKLATVKGRQGGRVNYLDVGFSRRAKDFLQYWLSLSSTKFSNENDFVFPQIVNGKASQMTVSQASDLNIAFVKLGLPPLRSQRFRKTKATLIMRSTESIFSVAEGLNNEVVTVNKHYLDGDETTIEFSLAAALDIRQRTALGEPIQIAKENSFFKFKDPVREKYLLNQKVYASSVANGLRCTMPFGEKAVHLKKILIQNGLSDSNEKVACFKFFECFSCPFHAVIAEVQDIWLLLSFKDVVLETLTRPAVNSVPSKALSEAVSATENILSSVENSYPRIYKKAFEKYLIQPHPLWTDVEDLDMLVGVYK